MADLKGHFDSSQTPEARNFAPNSNGGFERAILRKSGDMIRGEVRIPISSIPMDYRQRTNCSCLCVSYIILTHPVNFPCVRKPDKTHDFRQSVD